MDQDLVIKAMIIGMVMLQTIAIIAILFADRELARALREIDKLSASLESRRAARRG